MALTAGSDRLLLTNTHMMNRGKKWLITSADDLGEWWRCRACVLAENKTLTPAIFMLHL